MESLETDGNASGGMGAHMGMHTYFWSGTNIPDLWFKGFNVYNSVGLGFLCLGLAALAIMMEGLRVLREFIREKVEHRTFHVHKRHPDMVPYMKKQRIHVHALQTGLHVVQTLLGYFLMLVVMTFNVWLAVAVVVGAGLGYFLFCVNAVPQPLARLACLSAKSAPPGTAPVSPNTSVNTSTDTSSMPLPSCLSAQAGPSSVRTSSPSSSRSPSPQGTRGTDNCAFQEERAPGEKTCCQEQT